MLAFTRHLPSPQGSLLGYNKPRIRAFQLKKKAMNVRKGVHVQPHFICSWKSSLLPAPGLPDLFKGLSSVTPGLRGHRWIWFTQTSSPTPPGQEDEPKAAGPPQPPAGDVGAFWWGQGEPITKQGGEGALLPSAGFSWPQDPTPANTTPPPARQKAGLSVCI